MSDKLKVDGPVHDVLLAAERILASIRQGGVKMFTKDDFMDHFYLTEKKTAEALWDALQSVQ